MKTIVLAYDDSASSMRALRRVVGLAKAFDAYVVVVNAARVLVGAGPRIGTIDPHDPPEVHHDALDHAKAVLEELDVAAAYDTFVGDPVDVILRAADDRNADLIVVGASEPELVTKLLGLTVSESLERCAHCDVLVVH